MIICLLSAPNPYTENLRSSFHSSRKLGFLFMSFLVCQPGCRCYGSERRLPRGILAHGHSQYSTSKMKSLGSHPGLMPSYSQNHRCFFRGTRIRCILLPENLLKIVVLGVHALFSRRLVKRRQGHRHDCAIAITNSSSYTASFPVLSLNNLIHVSEHV